jgi:hypothetical protein
MTQRLSDPGRLGAGSTLEFPFHYRPAVATDVRETWRLARERSSNPPPAPVRLDFWRLQMQEKAAGAG